MKYLLFLVITAMMVHFCDAQKNQPLRIGWINEGLSGMEVKGVRAFIQKQKDLLVDSISIDDVTEKYLHSHNITHLWWLKDSRAITDKEKEYGEVLKHFVELGGHLILSMDAVRLLNDWGIEKNTFDIREDSVIDEGFGRPLGFHGYQTHPIYDGLHGGSYPWKGKIDHIVRKIGFFGNHLPDTSIVKVIGIGWSYITFHEDEKMVLEYKLGKGSIVAIGAYSYFSRPNFNTEELYRFYDNIFNYTAGRIHGIKEGYWAYQHSKVVPVNRKINPVKITVASDWKLPSLTLQLQRSEAANNFVNVAGRRMLLMGKERGGIEEIWTHPFMAFRDILTAVQIRGEDTLIWLNKLIPQIIVSPEMIIRKYAIGTDTLREMVTVDFDKPVGVLHYEWTGNAIGKIWLRFTSNLRMMWPYSDTSSPVMEYQWSTSMNAAIISNLHAGSQSILGFSSRPENHSLGQYNNFQIEGGSILGVGTTLQQVSGCFGFDAKKLEGKFNAYIVGGNESAGATIALYKKMMPELNSLYRASAEYYQRLLKTQVMITTPDKKFNEGYRWALVRADQFLQTTPGVGTSLMAGFGTTASGWNGRQTISGRPGYAWYFGRDGEWSAMALDALGGYEKVKEVLDMFVKFQAVNGKILHELTSSGTVHYDASDATPLFVVLASHYLHYSGNITYIRKIWPAIKRAMDFCYSTDTDHDGLIENTNVGHGWVEGGPLFGAHTEFYLAGSWAAALDGAAYITGCLGLPELKDNYSSDAKRVKEIIDHDFWSEAEGHFYNGKMLGGSYMKDATVLQAVPILLNAVIDFQKAWQATDAFSANNFSTDWGMRIIPDDNPKFNSGAYHAGMVWPLFSGYASLAEYKTGHFNSGFTHIMNNLLEYKTWALGSVPETLNGKKYLPNGVCSLQGWSETMIIQPAIEGMLGYSPDAAAGQLTMSPCFPWNWKETEVSQLRFGNTTFKMKMNQSEDRYDYKFEKKDQTLINLNFNPVLPYGTKVNRIVVNSKEINFTTTIMGEGVKVNMTSLDFNNKLDIAIYYIGGAGVLPLVNEPKPGDSNTGAKIIGQLWKQNTFSISVEGVPGKTVQFNLFSINTPKKIDNGMITKINKTSYNITSTIPKGNEGSGIQKVIIHY